MPFKFDFIFISGSFFIAFWNLNFNYNHLASKVKQNNIMNNTLLKWNVEINKPWVNFTHSLEKTLFLTLQLIFINTTFHQHAASMPISWLMVYNVIIRFCKANLIIYLSSRVLVMEDIEMMFSMTLRSPLILFVWQWWMFTNVTTDFTEILSLNKQRSLLRISQSDIHYSWRSFTLSTIGYYLALNITQNK